MFLLERLGACEVLSEDYSEGVNAPSYICRRRRSSKILRVSGDK
jgi:hypothetical protein